ncbi:MAG: serine protein kinase RIO [Candidatus Thermoplasmatota archaeon]|nr:serine protein kinase RIO [Candidatus Thermoplasmatota archaeon]
MTSKTKTEAQHSLLKEKINIPGRKTYEEVFDKRTFLELYSLMKEGVIDIIDYPISTGKEAKVFRGEQKDGTPIAVKIMRINTAVFKEYKKYIEGDHRFKDTSKSGLKLIYAWTRKEFSNLRAMHDGGIKVPEPISFSKNILIMEYLQHRDHPAPMLKDVDIDKEDMEYVSREILGYMDTLYNDLEMVHGDLSEFNVLISGGYPYLIDVSQSVFLDHPQAEELLKRDINNFVRYFKDNDVDISEDDVIEKIGIEEKIEV